jgi:hypothetical protein
MPSCDPFRQNHRRFIADTILDEYSDLSDENFFLCIGKVTPWGATAEQPPQAFDTVEVETDFWRGLVAAKRINRNDMSMVVRRIDWEPGVVYQPYRNNIDLFDDINPANFYALVDEERVYVCIDNNLGEPSTVTPTHTDSIIRKLSDGYRWKFLYQIPESKRKFLTKSRVGAIGYMPIEFVESLRSNDDRFLQWQVQNSAVDGKIEFAYMDEAAKAYWVTTASCILPSSANLVAQNAVPGATTVQIASPELTPDSNLYEGMMISFDGGPGQGQRRVIKQYSWLGTTARIFVDPLILGLSGTSDPAKQSFFSIQPRITVKGDGTSYENINNPTIRTADFQLKFGETADTSIECSIVAPRYIKSVEIVDGGKNYTFAELNIVKGLTTILPNTPNEYLDFTKVLHAVIPPPGGHGANPLRELGAASYMIVKNYDRDEDGKVDTDNDFRQFGILRNPILSEKQVRIKFNQAGLSGSFTVGATAMQMTGAYGAPYGKVVEWCPGYSGVTATSELVLTNIRGGTFAAGATMSGLTIFDVVTKTVAGSEARHLLNLTLTPENVEFLSVGGDYKRKHFAHGVGDRRTNIPQSRSSGEICDWLASGGTLLYGTLKLENPKGRFYIGETVLQTEPYFSGSNGSTGQGKIYAIDTEVCCSPATYDLTTSLTLYGEGFENDTFYKDSFVSFLTGSTEGNGYIVDWNPVTGGTSGVLRLAGVQGDIVKGQLIDYTTLGASGTTVTISGSILSVNHLGELKYRSGEVLYIQNIKPIQRDLEQREEIKLVIDF